MKILIVVYSRTGTTKLVADNLVLELGAELAEIKDTKNRLGSLGYIKAGKDAFQKKMTNIKGLNHKPGDFDLVIIGTPTWVGTMTPAIRTFLNENKNKISGKVAFFVTQGSPRRQNVFQDMQTVLDKKPLAELQLTAKQVRQNLYREELANFVKLLKQ